jgi:hypothetical protein
MVRDTAVIRTRVGLGTAAPSVGRRTEPHEPISSHTLLMIRPSLAEIRRLLARTLLTTTRGIDHVLHWSLFRRLHQTRALISHYRRRGDPLPAELRM